MDTKKKRNKKKKGNQGNNTGDVTSNTGEAAPQCHNHESASKNHHNGADADDAMSSVGEGVSQYQNHEPTPQANQNSANVDDTISSVEEGIPMFQNREPAMTHDNHMVSNAVHEDERSVGMSESSVELDMHRVCEAKLDKLHGTIKQLEDEKSLWLQKMSMVEIELEKLHNKVGYHVQNEVLLEEKLNNLQNGYDVLVKKEEVLNNKVRCIEDVNDVLTHETSLKERLSGLEETNKALQVQVKVLDEASKSSTEENQRLVKSLDEHESRLQALEAKVVLTESSMTKEAPENKVMDQTDLSGPLLDKQTNVIGKGNQLIADRGLSSSETIISDNNYSHINNSPNSAYASNHLDETTMQFMETASSNSAAQGLLNADAHRGSKQVYDEPRVSEEIVPVPLDDIQIHEDDPQPPGADDEIAEVPFSDAPIVGAPFRLISFVARYVSGADLVNQK